MIFERSILQRHGVFSKNDILEISRIDNEFSRLLTFREFPMSCPVFPIRLAQAGFSYENNGDEVICKQCELRYRDWEKDSDPFHIHASLSPNCEFIKQSNKLSSAACGGPLDILQPLKRERSPDPIFSKTESKMRNEIEKSKENKTKVEVKDVSPLKFDTETVQENKTVVEIKNVSPLIDATVSPKYPQFAILNRRVMSYKKWPSHLKQRPEELSKAGFFYEGKKDKVKCFHCAGGLSQWEREDDPWIQHAQWFPKCNFLKQCKGEKFISDVVNGKLKQMKNENEQHTDSNDYSGQEASNKSVEFDHPAVISVMEIGYTRSDVIKALKHPNLKNRETLSAETLLLTLWDIDESSNESNTSFHPEEETPVTPTEITHKCHVSENANYSQELIKENELLKQQRMCKVCLDEEASIVFLPCGHLVTCGVCASALRKCPICRSHINGTVRAIIS